MWEKVRARKHAPEAVFPATFRKGTDGDGDGDGDGGEMGYMLFGTVHYTLRTGEEKEMAWAGHARLREAAEGKLAYTYYRVYIQP